MRALVDEYLSRRLSRRAFIGRMVDWGFSAAAATSILDSLTPLVAAAAPSGSGAGPVAPATVVEGTGGELLVAQLHAAGVRFVFNCYSSNTYPVFDALVDRPEVQVIQLPQEGQMVAMAQGYTLASGKIAFTLNDSVGFPNTLNNLYNAWKDRTPIVVGSQREPSDLQGGRDAHEEWDDFLGPSASFTRWRWSVEQADRIPEITRRAFTIASTPPGGPVTLAFPSSALAATGLKAAVLDHDKFLLRPRVKPAAAAVERAGRLLAGAANPLLVVGAEVTRSGGNRALVDLAERLSIPVLQGEMLFDDFPTLHPLFLGYGWSTPEAVDVVVNVGAKMPPQNGLLPSGARVVHVSIDAESIGRVVPTDVGIVGDVKEAAHDLIAVIDATMPKARRLKIRDERLAAVRAHTEAQRSRKMRVAQGRWTLHPLTVERLAGELNAHLEKDAVIVLELARGDWLDQLHFGQGGKSRIGKTTGSALGWGIGAAMGVKLAQPDRQVVALQGDGGFLFGQVESLWTMARYEIPVIVVIFDNRSYNGPRDRVFREGGRQAQTGKDLTCYLGDPDVDFAKVAAGFGVNGEVVRSADQVAPAIARATASVRDGKPYLIDAIVARTGLGADSTWHPRYSVAAGRTRKV
jgi:thiamine pyrophosphate-dependent acetolactate synthase large subunit-like protein